VADVTYDLIIRNGTLVDGTGAPSRQADVAITDGTIAKVAPQISGTAAEEIDAEGLLVTPGFVDIHTHYDGQVTWDPVLEPSTLHGVTTLVMGNCGVGFAPVHKGEEEWLIQLMEGVEQIPGAALAEGIDWQWESFPEYLDAVATRSLAVDVGAMISHGALRAYVMGERGARNEPASGEEIAEMKKLVAEALEAGALGFSTSRTLAHRAIDGEPVPGTFAAEDELFGIGEALGETGRGVFELAPTGTAGEDILAPHKEVEWMVRLSKATGRPVSFALVQVDAAPDLWRELMDKSAAANESGAQLYPQVANRPAGVLMGMQTGGGFRGRRSWDELCELPMEERVRRAGEPAVREQILAEEPVTDNPFAEYMATNLDKIYVLGNPPDYEPGPERTVAAIAAAEGMSTEAKLYDLLLEDEGKALLMFPFLNYSYGDAEAQREMLLHPAGVAGLSDGGAHCASICDASMPTWALTHWARDRSRGEKLPVEFIVKKQTADTAALFGLTDRGTVEVGKRADLNVIDFEALQLDPPRLVSDLPAGGSRFLQAARGYRYTIVAGTVTRKDGADTGARPGRLVRSR
jgi:N-acyl-D-amino-acid deacylase